MRLSLVAGAAVLTLAGPVRAMTISTPDFKPGGPIAPAQIYPRCGGQNISPALAWSGVPKGAQSLALTMIDLDVKPAGWSHWIVVDLPAATTGLARGAALPQGAHGVVSNFGDAKYDGPCPPAGSGRHRYEITVWALSRRVDLKPDEAATQVQAALAAAALDHATVMGWVER